MLGWLAYLALFYSSPLASLPARDDGPWRRYQLLQYLLAPDVLWQEWTAGTGRVALADRVTVLAPAAWMALAAAALGWLLLCALRAQRGLSRGEALVFSLAAGTSVLSTLTLALGWAGWLGDAQWLWLGEAAIVLIAAMALWRARQTETEPDEPPDAEELAAARADAANAVWHRALALVALVFAAVLVLGAMLPPVEFDVREYHLQAPKEFFGQGRVTYLPHNAYANMPLGLEMLSLHAMALTGDVERGALVGKTLLAGVSLLAAAGTFLLARRWFGKSDAYWGAVLLLSTPWMIRNSAAGLIDAALGAYVVLAIHAGLLWRQAADTEGETSDAADGLLALCGLLAGSAAACKYPAAVFVTLPLGLWVLYVGRRAPLRSGLWFVVPATAAFGLWLVKNLVLIGNPIYPLRLPLVGEGMRTVAHPAAWVQAHAPHGYSPGELAESAAGVLLGSDWLSPLLWPLALVALRYAVPRSLARGLLGYVLLLLALWWLLTHRIDRFWLPALPVLAAAAGAGAAALDEGRTRLLFRILAGFCLAANLLYCTLAGPGAYNRFFSSLDGAWRDPLRIAPWHVWLNEHVPPDAAVLTVAEAEVFDLRPRVLYDTPFDACQLEVIVAGNDPATIRQRLTQHHVSHVLVRWDEIERYRTPGNYGYSEFVTPEVFDTLVEQGVLDPPAAMFGEGRVEIYPVARP